MLCEQCHEREATVHVTMIVAPSGTMTKHDYCESCFRQNDTHAKAATAGWTDDSPTISEEVPALSDETLMLPAEEVAQRLREKASHE